jgi:photosystem II stability/assembly factor-like uncharacterized protein
VGQLEPDRLEHELRDVLTHERRALSTDLVDLDRVYAGAARRRRRRTALVSSAGVLVLAAVALPVGLSLTGGDRQGGHVQVAARSPHTLLTTPAPAPSSPAPTAGTTAPVGIVWTRSTRVDSVTATSTRTIVVLGSDARCRGGQCLALVQSSDGGATFTALVAPPGGSLARGSVTSVRFGSAQDGWAFGDALYATHDGGLSWTAVKTGGKVNRLESAAGRVWALVTEPGDVSTHLWSSPTSRDDWQRVPSVNVTAPADLTVQQKHVVVISAGDSPAYVGEDGAFQVVDNPCVGSVEARLSATSSIWALCETGTAGRLFFSPDGQKWQQVVPQGQAGSLSNQTVVGARTDADALLGADPQRSLSRLLINGEVRKVSRPPTAGALPAYVGFTSADVGYTITNGQLWRTQDGGDTWKRMRIG